MTGPSRLPAVLMGKAVVLLVGLALVAGCARSSGSGQPDVDVGSDQATDSLSATTGGSSSSTGSGSTPAPDPATAGPADSNPAAASPDQEPTVETTERSSTEPSVDRPSAVSCGADPDLLGFDPFYDQHCDAAGIPVLASGLVAPEAVAATAEVLVAMIGHRPDLIEAMITNGLRVGVMARSEVVSDLPEYRNIYELFPGTDWDTRTRGLGATLFIPLSSVAEENVLCLPDDVYRGESILVHEFAHTVHIMGLDTVDPTFSPRLEQTYRLAMDSGRWADTYAATDSAEYFAEAVQSWFDSNQAGPPDGDGIHNDIDTRVELAGYDADVHRLVADVFTTDPLPLCQP